MVDEDCLWWWWLMNSLFQLPSDDWWWNPVVKSTRVGEASENLGKETTKNHDPIHQVAIKHSHDFAIQEVNNNNGIIRHFSHSVPVNWPQFSPGCIWIIAKESCIGTTKPMGEAESTWIPSIEGVLCAYSTWVWYIWFFPCQRRCLRKFREYYVDKGFCTVGKHTVPLTSVCIYVKFWKVKAHAKPAGNYSTYHQTTAHIIKQAENRLKFVIFSVKIWITKHAPWVAFLIFVVAFVAVRMWSCMSFFCVSRWYSA